MKRVLGQWLLRNFGERFEPYAKCNIVLLESSAYDKRTYRPLVLEELEGRRLGPQLCEEGVDG